MPICCNEKAIWQKNGGKKMGLGKLKDYGLKFKELKDVCVSLNEAGIAPAVTVKALLPRETLPRVSKSPDTNKSFEEDM